MSQNLRQEEKQESADSALGRHSPQFTPRSDNITEAQHSARKLLGERGVQGQFFTAKAKANAGITAGSLTTAAGAALVATAIVLSWGLAAVIVTSAVTATAVALIIAAAVYRSKTDKKQSVMMSGDDSPRVSDSPDTIRKSIIMR